MIKLTYNLLLLDESLSDCTAISPTDIIKLLEFYLSTTYFQFRGKMYYQKNGLAMGSPVSPVLANIYLEALETKVLSSSTHAPRFWQRYVDDIFAVVRVRSLLKFLDHLNSQRKILSMKLKKISYFPSLILLDFKSHHPRSAKLSTVPSLIKRNLSVSSPPTNRNVENSYLKRVFTINHYPPTLIRQVSLQCTHPVSPPEREKQLT